MSQTSKSPLAVAVVAYETAKVSLPAYTHLKSPKKFTQHQLVACLVLKEFFTTDYRGIEAILSDSSDLQHILELHEIPHFTTLQKTARNIFHKKSFQKLLKGVLGKARKGKLIRNKIKLAAIDGTGFESHHVSRYFVQRRDRTVHEKYQTTHYQHYPKAGLVCDTKNHLILSAVPERGPQFDRTHFCQAVKEASIQMPIKKLVADAGYDGENSHTYAREKFKIQTIIPPLIGKKTDKLPTGKYRRLMATGFDKKSYGQRWQIETVNSMLKRNLGSFLRARNYWSQCREIFLRVLTHNIMIVLFE